MSYPPHLMDFENSLTSTEELAMRLLTQLRQDANGGRRVSDVGSALRRAGIPKRERRRFLVNIGACRFWTDSGVPKVGFSPGVLPQAPRPQPSPLSASQLRRQGLSQNQTALTLLKALASTSAGVLRMDQVGVELRRAGMDHRQRKTFLDTLDRIEGCVRWSEGWVAMIEFTDPDLRRAVARMK